MIRRPPRSTLDRSSAASDVYKRQVAKQLSFTKAAEVLFMTQPAVTFQIKQLEEHFNTRLFDRGHGRIALTPAGDVVPVSYTHLTLPTSDLV